jgi:hypothetical protein
MMLPGFIRFYNFALPLFQAKGAKSFFAKLSAFRLLGMKTFFLCPAYP